MFGKSLHGANGFAIFLLGGYALCSLKWLKEKRFFLSDILRLVLLYFIFGEKNWRYISSPGSDLLALGLSCYLFIKWVSYLEENKREVAPYAILCLLGVYAISVKLSAAMVVLFTIKPAVELIKRKQWKEIGLYLSLGLLIILPFLARNVIISGYLVYPYPELDLFQVDWKMPEYTLLYDRNEIKAWGWGLKNVFRSNAPFQEWFPVWIGTLSSTMRIAFWMSVVLLIPVVAWNIRKGIVEKEWDSLLVVAVAVACLALWFIGAPLPRYGRVFLLFVPAFALSEMMKQLPQRAAQKAVRGAAVVAMALVLLWIVPAIDGAFEQGVTLMESPDYRFLPAEGTGLGPEPVYFPVYGDQAGYHNFPSTPYPKRFALIELRGDTLADGFRMKEEYRDAFVMTDGNILQENMFE